MSGGSPRDRALLPEDAAGRQAVAGEYVLGTLDARMAARVALAMQSDPLWRQEVETWQGLLAPLVALTAPESPPPDTWDRIETRIAPPQPRRRGLRPGRFTWLWQAWAIGATLAAAAIAGMVYVPRGGAPGMMTVLVTDRNAPALTAEVQSNGALRLASYPAAMGQRLAAPSGRQLELWGLAPGAKAPVSLGLLPHEPARITVVPAAKVRPVQGMLIMISIEPDGGSPSGLPTGPVVFYGRLSAAGPNS